MKNDVDVLAVLKKLPVKCLVVRPSGGVSWVKRGEMGHYAVVLPEPLTKDEISAINRQSGVTPAQAEAMLAGSMFGWDCPAADPDFYDEAGMFNARALATS